jgi:multidrug transporter EmrE-like cation transporter
MNRTGLIGLILLSVALNALAQILLRWGARSAPLLADGRSLAAMVDTLFRPGILGGLACYGLSVLVWIRVLGMAEVSFAYPFLGLGFVLVMLAGWQLFGEPLTPARVAGTALIAFGVLVLARS